MMIALHVKAQGFFLVEADVADLAAKSVVPQSPHLLVAVLLLQDLGRDLPEETRGQARLGTPGLLPDRGMIVILEVKILQSEIVRGHGCVGDAKVEVQVTVVRKRELSSFQIPWEYTRLLLHHLDAIKLSFLRNKLQVMIFIYIVKSASSAGEASRLRYFN